jgi:hypothetical protein
MKLMVNNECESQDIVQYIAAPEGSFVHALQNREEVRAAITSDYVYNKNMDADASNFCLKVLNANDMKNIGINEGIITSMNPFAESIEGFQARLYKDYISQKYILAFAGTDPSEAPDLWEDFWQFWGIPLYQYDEAMRLANYLVNTSNTVVTNNLLITGHSLGGGLATAAMCVTGKQTITFNSAKLERNTLYARDSKGNLLLNPLGGHIEKYLGAVAHYELASKYCDSYYVDGEFISIFQTAPGERKELMGWFKRLPVLPHQIPGVLHKMKPSVYYGLLVTGTGFWYNIITENLYDGDKDLVGY